MTDNTEALPPLPERDCQGCNGSGTIRAMTSHLGPDDHEFDQCCPACQGTGSADLRDAINALGYWTHKTDVERIVVERSAVLRIISARAALAQRQQVPEDQAWACGLMPIIEDYAKAVHDGDDAKCSVLRRVIEASLTAAPQAAEPVAWRFNINEGVEGMEPAWSYWSAHPGNKVFTVQPLYTAPQAAEPEKPVAQHFGIIDPDYARIYTQARIIAWQYGFACLAHGSFTRDLDLLLVPWTDAAQADDVDYFAPRIAEAAGLKVSPHPASDRPHGRKTWTLLLPGFAEPRWVDLSVLSPTAPQAAQAQPSTDLRADFERECADTDKLLTALGWEPQNCRTDGGSLKIGMILEALEARDRLIRREAAQAQPHEPPRSAPLTEEERAMTAMERYSELLMAVGNKYPGETRHETALRYIRNAERSSASDAVANCISTPEEQR